MSEIWQKRLLVVAAAWNVLGGIGALLDPSQHFAQMYRGSLNLDDPVQMHFFQTVWIAVIAWGFAYLAAAVQPASRPVVLLTGGGGKLAYSAVCAALFFQGTGTAALLAVGIADLIFAGLFAAAAMGRQDPAHALSRSHSFSLKMR